MLSEVRLSSLVPSWFSAQFPTSPFAASASIHLFNIFFLTDPGTGPSEQTCGGLMISLLCDVAFFFFFLLHIDQKHHKFCFYFSLKEKLRNKQAVPEDGNSECPSSWN